MQTEENRLVSTISWTEHFVNCNLPSTLRYLLIKPLNPFMVMISCFCQLQPVIKVQHQANKQAIILLISYKHTEFFHYVNQTLHASSTVQLLHYSCVVFYPDGKQCTHTHTHILSSCNQCAHVLLQLTFNCLSWSALAFLAELTASIDHCERLYSF